VTEPLRILVVDDSVVVRRLVGEALASEPGIASTTASDGRIALAKIAQSPPDLVVLDIEMPELDGLATLAAIRKGNPHLPVVMFSALTQRAAAATIEALSMGANDYVTKPDGNGNLGTAREVIRNQLVPKIRALCKRDGHGRSRSSAPPPLGTMQLSAIRGPTAMLPKISTSMIPRISTSKIPRLAPLAPSAPHGPAPAAAVIGPASLVVIGVSTGGPPALQTLLSELPHLPVPVLIVQHMPPDFTAMLAKRLASVTPHPVVEATDGLPVGAGQIVIAKGDHHLRVEPGAAGPILRLDKGAPENSCRPAVDVLFRSAAEHYGARALAVVMTGMGQDGLRGAELIRRYHGNVLIQDEASSVVWGMPGAIARAQQYDAILSLGGIARELVRRTQRLGGRP
jgi:two-component system, chemotaxis family, protein-glutamate methylesterase/glutaminase